MRALLLLAVGLLVLAPPLSPSVRADDAAAPTTEVLPLDAVRPGMRGVAHTVFAGTRVETFEVVVLDVIRNWLSKQDIILVRCPEERLQHTGVAQGMSGSPVYVDGKLVGALAYTWSWAKETLGGITPIEAMLAEGERPLEGRPSGAEPPTPLRTPRPQRVRSEQELAPIGTPVSTAGFSAEGRARLQDVLADVGLDVRGAGGGLVAGAPGGWANLDAPLVPGAALTVDLLRGDYSISVLGTCTHVDGDKVYGFGHGFQDVGETSYPLCVGYVYTVVPSRNLSFKLGASIREVGALVQDRQSGIVGILGRKAPMVPFDVTLRNTGTGRREGFHFEVTANRLFFQRFMLAALRESFAKAEATLGVNTKRYTLTVKLKGVDEEWTYDDAFVGFDSGLSRVLIGLVDRVLNHGSQRAEFESVKLDVAIENVDRRATIETARSSKDEARPGDTLDLLVRLRFREGGSLVHQSIPVRIPSDARPGNFSISVVGGDNVAADVAAPVDVVDIPRLYDAFYKSTELVALVPTGRVNLDVNGHLYRNLPLSTVPRLARSPSAGRVKVYPTTERVRRDVPFIVTGSAKAVVRVVE